jgi:hypothetical protein
LAAFLGIYLEDAIKLLQVWTILIE